MSQSKMKLSFGVLRQEKIAFFDDIDFLATSVGKIISMF
jgi:hypothetical protein